MCAPWCVCTYAALAVYIMCLCLSGHQSLGIVAKLPIFVSMPTMWVCRCGVCCLVCMWVCVRGCLDPSVGRCPRSALQDGSVGRAELPVLRRAKVALFSEASTQTLQGTTWGLQGETLVLKPTHCLRIDPVTLGSSSLPSLPPLVEEAVTHGDSQCSPGSCAVVPPGLGQFPLSQSLWGLFTLQSKAACCGPAPMPGASTHIILTTASLGTGGVYPLSRSKNRGSEE